EKEDAESRPTDATTPAAEEEKPARKEPVIFAPKPGAAEPNGTAKAKPDPVIFAPAKTDTAPETAAKPEPETKPKPEAQPKPEAEAKPEAKPEAAVKTEPKPEAKKPEAKPEAEAEAEVKAEAETKPKAESKATPEEAVAQPAVAQPVTMEAEEQPKPKKAAKAKTEPAKAKEKEKLAEAAETVRDAGSEPAHLGAGELAEPIPGFASLSVASLRARMRGKTEEQIAEYLAYEQATSARPEVIRMYENRLAKLRSGA